MELELVDEGATRRLGARLGELLQPGDVLLLEGELGAGKTFLVRALARSLGVPDRVPVTSPTFALVHELPAQIPLYHADLYRLGDPDELVELGLLDHLGRDAIVVMEWGERFSEHIGPATLVLRLEIVGPTSRRALIEAGTARGREMMGRLAG